MRLYSGTAKGITIGLRTVVYVCILTFAILCAREYIFAASAFQKRDELLGSIEKRKARLAEVIKQKEEEFRARQDEISGYQELSQAVDQELNRRQQKAAVELSNFDKTAGEQVALEDEKITGAGADIDTMKIRVQDLSKKKAVIEGKINSLRPAEISSALSEKKSLESEISQCEKDLIAERAKLDGATEKSRRVAEERQSMTKIRWDKKTAEGSEALATIELLGQEKKKADKEVESLKVSVRDKENKLRTLRNRLDTINRKGFDKKLENLAALEKELETCNAELAEADKALGAAEKKRAMLEENLGCIKTSYDEMRTRKSAELLEEIKPLEDKASSYRARLEFLQKKLDCDKKDFDTVAKEMTDEINKLETRLVPSPVVENPDTAKEISTTTEEENPSETSRPIRRVRPEYYLSIGDALYIMVWRVPDLSLTVEVGPDGRISYPLLGEINVEGMSLTELDEVITEGLKEYVTDPQVSIIIKKFGGRKFVVLGEVRMPGVYRFVENVSVLEAIALAGGFVKYAEQNNVVLVRGDINKSPKVQVIKVNASAVLYQGSVCENLMIQQGDIIYVTQSFIGRLNDFLTDTLRPALEDMVDFFVVRSAWRWQAGQHRN